MNRQITIIVFIIGAFNLTGSINGCSQRSAVDSDKGVPMTGRSIEQVQEAYTDEWMAIEGVEGVAIGLFEDKPCIKIFSSKKAEELRRKIPSTVEDYPVIIEETGTFHALDQ